MKIRITADVAALVAHSIPEAEAERLAGNVVDVADVDAHCAKVGPTTENTNCYAMWHTGWYLSGNLGHYEVIDG